MDHTHLFRFLFFLLVIIVSIVISAGPLILATIIECNISLSNYIRYKNFISISLYLYYIIGLLVIAYIATG